MTSRRLLQPDHLKQVMQRYLDRLREHRDALNRLNVYPVPDGDTGTNMTQTIEAVMVEVEGTVTMADLTAAISYGSLMGAQGNSGIILSQILRGLSDAFSDHGSIGIAELVRALDRASVAAYRAVGTPVEGTILTVLREASEAANETGTPQGTDLAAFLQGVYDRAEDALRRTPELLPVLKEAGVVDAGGAGFLLLLGAFLEEVTGEEVIPPAVLAAVADVGVAMTADAGSDRSIADLRYEVMYLLASDQSDAGDRLRAAWGDIGDSIVVVGGDGAWNCHIHTDHIGPAIEAGIAIGTPSRIKITDLLEQAADEAAHRSPTTGFAPLAAFAAAPVGVVAVAAGEGIAALFRDAGAQGLVRGGQTMNPSVRALLDVVEDVPAPSVIVLPNNKNIIPVAEQLDALSTKQVHVVATRSVPEGIAAMFGYAPDGEPGSVVDAMRSSAAGCTSGELTRAVRDSMTPAGPIIRGDWLGIVDGVVSVVASGAIADALIALVGAVADIDAEIVTVLTGVDADASATAAMAAWLAEHRPGASVEILDGGQPLYPYLVGAE